MLPKLAGRSGPRKGRDYSLLSIIIKLFWLERSGVTFKAAWNSSSPLEDAIFLMDKADDSASLMIIFKGEGKD